ncbi:MAG: tautomerase family protein [Pseudomonadota bacterium]|nr:tautomerase family protein [Pseudomonadota bacterium]
MPLIDITLPEDALSAEQEQQLAEIVTNSLLTLEAMQDNPKAKMLTWVYLHKHPQSDYFIGGKHSVKPHYRIDVTVFANTLPDAHKEKLTKQLTEKVLNLEGTDVNLLNSARVWVLFHEVEDGNWGGAGQIYRLNDLMKMMQSSK